MFVWGKHFEEELSLYSPGQKFYITGNHTIQPKGFRSIQKEIKELGFIIQGIHPTVIGSGSHNAFLGLIAQTAITHPHVRIVVREHPDIPLEFEEKKRFQYCTNIRFSTH